MEDTLAKDSEKSITDQHHNDGKPREEKIIPFITPSNCREIAAAAYAIDVSEALITGSYLLLTTVLHNVRIFYNYSTSVA